MHALGDLIAGKYVLGQPVGAGGMGIVYRARQLALERRVAIKMVRPELATSAPFRERFRHEAIAAARSAHPNVVAIIDFHDDDADPQLVMSYVAGMRAGELLAQGCTLARVINVIEQVLAALAVAHARGIVHGDIKSDNILVSVEEHHEHATLIDFGLARIADLPRSPGLPRAISGTPEYVAPEVIGGEPPTAASDLYGVGIVLYEMLTGATPFGGAEPPVIMTRHLDEPVPPLRTRCLQPIPRALERLVMRALQKDPRLRLAHANAFRDELLSIPLTRDSAPIMVTKPPSFDEDGITQDLSRCAG